VNCRVTEDSSTPLHKACAGSKSGHLEAVKLLLESNADVHALNKWRETPLLTAANHGQAGAVEQLLRAGADPCKCTDTGWSPLSIAAYKGHDEVVKLLLEEGAPTEEADPTLSALLQAATKGLPDTVELLLRHGADHTVTTKKGDTALSILVEQNLIDAAVEMVTEYKASIPRCSRDRKKVQRARLLINLRVKQQQRESGSGDDDGDSTMASGNQTNNSNSRKKKKKKKNSAELEAKAAEEALLLELEQEDADRHKQEQDASKKSAKKRKKKDRERQLKKEQEDKLIAEEMKKEEKRRKEEEAKDAAEREERQRLVMARKKEEDETRRKQEKSIRQQQQKEQQMHRKKLRKEEEERKKLLQQKESAEKVNNGNGKNGQRSVVQSVEGQKQTPQSSSTNQTNAVVAKNGVPKKGNSTKSGGNKRGWESIPAAKKSVSETSNTTSTTNGSKQQAVTSSKPDTANDKTALDQESYASSRNSNESIVGTESTVTATVNQHQKHANSMDSSSTTTVSSGDYAISISSQNQNVAPNPIHIAAVRIEPPAVSVFRHGKVSELLNRCSAAKATTDPLGSVDSIVVKKVLFRWIMRAAHECSAYVDFIIPSWNDLNKLSTFFQRQFISETRKLVPNTGNSIRMETLKEAGTVLAHLCHSFAKDVAEFHRRVVDQLPPDWNDAIIGVSVSGVPSNLESSTVVINWANQSQVTMSTSVFMRLKERFKGATPQFLSSIFVCKTCYDTKLLLIENTSMDYSLTSNTRSNISSELSVSAEAWSDPFSALSSNSFWGQFAEIDRMFGGLEPFGACDINDDLLCKHGGSISVLAPPDNMLASRYLNRMVDILDSCEQTNLPVSFAVFIRSECLVNQKSPPCTDDLYTLEPRLRNRVNYMSRVETLDEGRHYYFSEKLGGPNASTTTSLFVLLQNSSGKDRFRLRNVGMLEIMNSTKTEIKRVDEPRLVDSAPTTYAPEMTQRNDDNAYISHSAHFIQPQPSTNLPASPVPPHSTLTTDFDFGSTFPSSFGQDSSSGVRTSRAGTRRGRLFDLVDNGEEDNTMNDVDVVSGMLGTLNVDLFQNSGAQDVDIEAISLMGIGDPSHAPTAFHPRSNKTQGRFG
ncbi:MAG: ankyrin repeat protein, partial [Bacillariaceae sp.]|jgi:ankyrin repeat protein